jgi:hypothetical protein
MRRFLPVLVLLILSPLIAEWLLGSSPISRIYLLPLMGGAYGTGAIVVREVAVRRGLRWSRIVLLAVAFAILLEGLVFQTCFNPHFVGYLDVYGRWLGVNWYWSEFIIGWHAIWTVSVPILLTDLLFPTYQQRPWLGNVGLIVTGIACIVCNILNFIIYYLYVTPGFLASPLLLVCTALVIIGLIVLALALPARSRISASAITVESMTSLWLIGAVVFLVSLYWLGIHELISPTFPVPALVLIAIGAVLAAGMAWLINRWSQREGWQRVAYLRTLVVGSLLAGALIGAKIVEDGNPVDQLGQAALALILVVFLMIWNLRQHRSKTVFE